MGPGFRQSPARPGPRCPGNASDRFSVPAQRGNPKLTFNCNPSSFSIFITPSTPGKYFPGSLCLRQAPELFHGAASDQPALVDDADTIAEPFGHLRDVRGEKYRFPRSQRSRKWFFRLLEDLGSSPTMGSSRIYTSGSVQQGRPPGPAFAASRGSMTGSGHP